MLKIHRYSAMNFENAVRGSRNPMSSWERMDSFVEHGDFVLGESDRKHLRRLCVAGSDHRKFLRQIFVSVDIEAPLYWWKEFDTYKIATVANSTSTMHKLHAKPIVVTDFSTDHMSGESLMRFETYVAYLEALRQRFVETGDKKVWYDLIQLLPSSYHQLRTVTLNYENLAGMYDRRKDHKLDEWRIFCAWIEDLPYAEDMILSCYAARG